MMVMRVMVVVFRSSMLLCLVVYVVCSFVRIVMYATTVGGTYSTMKVGVDPLQQRLADESACITEENCRYAPLCRAGW